MNQSIAVKLFLALVIIVLLLQAGHPAWSYHLRSDSDSFYYSRAKYFLEHGNLTSLGYNEYQPGAVMFFLALSLPLVVANNHDVYLTTLFGINIGLICLLAYFIWRATGHIANVWVLGAIVLFAGPIVLYRFDLFVSLLVIGAIMLWQRAKHNWAAFLLGVATATKIYPVLLVPYALILGYQKQGWRAVAKQAASFAAGLAAIILIYMAAFQVSLLQILTDLNINAQKPVHAESVWASLLTIGSKVITGHYVTGQGAFGIFGIASQHIIGGLEFYNYFWLVALALCYLWLARLPASSRRWDIKTSIVIILIFLVFSKILAPQYSLWFMLLFPLLRIPQQGKAQRRWLIDFWLILLVAFLSQYIYPLRYNELLGGFFTNGSSTGIFWLLAARNFILVGLAIRFLLAIGKRNTTRPLRLSAKLAE